MIFITPTDYLHALQGDPSLAFMPMQMVAELRGVSRAAIDRALSVGQLEEIRVGESRFVRVSSLVDQRRGYAAHVAKIRTRLEQIARRRQIVTYEPVMEVIGLSPKVPADRTKFGSILGVVSHDTWREHRVLLSVLVHRKTLGKTRPGPGFLKEFGEQLASGGTDDDRIDREIQRVWDFYTKATAAASAT